MKKVLKNVSFVILLLKICIIFGQETSTQKRIIIDVGHGGKDSGAIGINGIQEKDVVLNIANAILKLNNELDKPLDIYLTRYSDTLISLSDRTKLAKTLKADLFVSFHCNHSDNPNARGVEVYVADAESKYSDDSTWLAFQLPKLFQTLHLKLIRLTSVLQLWLLQNLSARLMYFDYHKMHLTFCTS